MESVHVWSLPETVRKRIIRRLKHTDLLELSLRSKDVHSLLKANKTLKLPQMELKWEFDGDDCYMIWRECYEINYCKIFFGENMQDSESTNSTSFCFKVDGDPKMKLVKRNGERFTVANCADHEEKLRAMEEISNRIVHFGDFKYDLNLANSKFDIMESFIFKITKSFEIAIVGDMYGRRDHFTARQSRFILEELQIEELILRRVEGEPLENVKLNQKSLTLGKCDWLHPRELLNSPQLEYISATFVCTDGLEESVKIAEAWQRGTHFSNLSYMELKARGNWTRGADIRFRENGTLRLIETDTEDVDFSGTIRRFTDGKMAQIHAYHRAAERQGGNSYRVFVMVVNGGVYDVSDEDEEDLDGEEDQLSEEEEENPSDQ